MKKLLNTLLVFILLSCGAQSYLENNNLGFCTDTVIPKDKYLFDINNYKKLAETEGYKNVVVDSDTTKTLLREDISYEKQKKYYKDIKTKKITFIQFIPMIVLVGSSRNIMTIVVQKSGKK